MYNTILIMSSLRLLNISSSNNTTTVFSLYRSKLRIANKMGYVYGKWNTHTHIYTKKNKLFSKIKTMKYIIDKNAGNIMANNVRYYYKQGVNVVDIKEINVLIDCGFYWLKRINDVYSYYVEMKSQRDNKLNSIYSDDYTNMVKVLSTGTRWS